MRYRQPISRATQKYQIETNGREPLPATTKDRYLMKFPLRLERKSRRKEETAFESAQTILSERHLRYLVFGRVGEASR